MSREVRLPRLSGPPIFLNFPVNDYGALPDERCEEL